MLIAEGVPMLTGEVAAADRAGTPTLALVVSIAACDIARFAFESLWRTLCSPSCEWSARNRPYGP